ncbi:MAG: SHOCT domain-containing protein [Gammaproteobacteria bacterium]|nr:SHOCT domain-containing protein [Gammaproteobacteria bacterium]
MSAEEGSANEHPVNFVDPESLAQLLASLQVVSEAEGKPVYLMSENQAIDAGKHLARALNRVDESQDVLMVSYRNVGKFPRARRLSTGARVFVEDNRLNLIFGQVDTFLDEFREPYAKQPATGGRGKSALSGGTLAAASWFTFKPGREDWVLFPINLTQSPRSQLRLESNAAPVAAGAATAAPNSSRAPAAASQASTSAATAPAAASVGAGAAAAGTAAKVEPNRWRDLEQGLETLQRLRDKGLITEAEYQSKRQALLDAVGM